MWSCWILAFLCSLGQPTFSFHDYPYLNKYACREKNNFYRIYVSEKSVKCNRSFSQIHERFFRSNYSISRKILSRSPRKQISTLFRWTGRFGLMLFSFLSTSVKLNKNGSPKFFRREVPGKHRVVLFLKLTSYGRL